MTTHAHRSTTHAHRSPSVASRALPRLLGLLAASLLIVPLGAAPAQPTRDVIAGDRAAVELAVQVTSRGETVRGLGADDFRLRVDGREVTIEGLTEVVDGHSRGPDESEEAVARHLLVFVDDFFTMPAQRNRLLADVSAQLDSLAPVDRMAIVAFDGRKLDLLSGWTRSLPQLRAALAAARERPSHGLERLAEQRQDEAARRLDEAPGTLPPGFSALGVERSLPSREPRMSLRRTRQVRDQISALVSAAGAALFAVPAPEDGRRLLVFLAGTWQLSSDAGLLSSENELFGARPLFQPLIESADRRGYAVYSVLVPTWTAEARRGRAEGSHEVQIEVLRRLANETCGLALVDGRNTALLARIAADSGTYYRLSFTPEWHHDDRRRRLEVELVDGGGRVRYRPGLADLSPRTVSARLAEGARLIGATIGD